MANCVPVFLPQQLLKPTLAPDSGEYKVETLSGRYTPLPQTCTPARPHVLNRAIVRRFDRAMADATELRSPSSTCRASAVTSGRGREFPA